MTGHTTRSLKYTMLILFMCVGLALLIYTRPESIKSGLKEFGDQSLGTEEHLKCLQESDVGGGFALGLCTGTLESRHMAQDYTGELSVQSMD
jgi:hypothetical protein